MKNRCYFCGNAHKTDALYDNLCLRHFFMTSWQIAWLKLRQGQFPSRLFFDLFVRDLWDRVRRKS